MKTARGRGGGSTSSTPPHVPVEDPNTLRSRSTVRFVDLLCEGEIVGLVHADGSVYFDDTPLNTVTQSGALGLRNFPNVSIASRVGTPDQTVLPGFPSAEGVELVATKVINATPVVRTVDDLDADHARVTIRIPELLYANDQGDVLMTSVAIKIEVKSFAGSYVTFVSETITGKCVSPYERTYLLANLPSLGAGPWSVRMSRLSADYDSARLFGETYFQSLSTVIDHRLIYPDSALIGVSADAESFGGGNPVRSYLIDGLKMQIPSNYNPTTRVYTGSWDGTFSTAFTTNPAWVFWAFATNKRWGLGEFLSASGLDKWALYTIAQYCDGLVPNGTGVNIGGTIYFGHTEPRYQCNGIVKNREEAIRVLLSLAAIFRGMVYFSAGAVTPTADMPSNPVKLVSPANVIGGEFRYQGQGLDARHTVAYVTWNNPALNYNPDIVVVEDKAGINSIGYRPIEVAAPLCTSRSQAHRHGEWILDTEKNEGDSVSYKCSWDHLGVFPGAIIKVADPAIAGLRAGGRVISATTTAITVDDPVDIDEDIDFSIDVTLADGSVETRVVTNPTGTYTVLNLASALPSAPQVASMWVLTSNIAPRLFRVVSISESGPGMYEVNALYHDPAKYARVERDFIAEEPDFTKLPTGDLEHPTSIATRQYLYDAGAGAIFGGITISWQTPSDSRVQRYEVETKRNGNEWTRAAIVGANAIDIRDFDRTESSFSLRVRSLDAFGRQSDWLTAATLEVSMFRDPPDNVLNFIVNVLSDLGTFSWSPVTTLGVSHYTIRFSPVTSGASWGTAQIVLDDIIGTSVTIPIQKGTYLIKAETLAGIQSVNEGSLITDVPGLIDYNVVTTFDADPTWTGTKVNCTVTGSDLRLDDGFTEGSITFAAIDLGEVLSSRVTVTLKAFGANTGNVMSSWGALSTVLSLSAADPSGWNVTTEERHTNDNPAGSPTWTDWKEIQVGTINARAHQVRLILRSFSPGTVPVADSFRYLIDMPDRHIIDKGLQSTTSGISVTFANAFIALKTVLITVTDLQTGEYWKVPTQSVTGFHVDVYNSSNAKIDRKVNYDAIGYGTVP